MKNSKDQPQPSQGGKAETTSPTPDATRDDRNASRGAKAGNDSDSLGGAKLQGEGNYTAARRHRESVEDFVDSGRVDKAARDAAPDNEREAQALRDAEKAGRSPARK